MLRYQLAGPSDFGSIPRAFPDWPNDLDMNNKTIFVMYDDNELVGCIAFTRVNTIAQLCYMVGKENVPNKNYAASLLLYCLAKGLPELGAFDRIEVRSDNHHEGLYYNSLGFTRATPQLYVLIHNPKTIEKLQLSIMDDGLAIEDRCVIGRHFPINPVKLGAHIYDKVNLLGAFFRNTGKIPHYYGAAITSPQTILDLPLARETWSKRLAAYQLAVKPLAQEENMVLAAHNVLRCDMDLKNLDSTAMSVLIRRYPEFTFEFIEFGKSSLLFLLFANLISTWMIRKDFTRVIRYAPLDFSYNQTHPFSVAMTHKIQTLGNSSFSQSGFNFTFSNTEPTLVAGIVFDPSLIFLDLIITLLEVCFCKLTHFPFKLNAKNIAVYLSMQILTIAVVLECNIWAANNLREFVVHGLFPIGMNKFLAEQGLNPGEFNNEINLGLDQITLDPPNYIYAILSLLIISVLVGQLLKVHAYCRFDAKLVRFLPKNNLDLQQELNQIKEQIIGNEPNIFAEEAAALMAKKMA